MRSNSEGKVYDVTGFLNDHPEDDDLILQYAGKDVEEAMKNKLEHEHSDTAYDMVNGFVIKRLGIVEAVVRNGLFFPKAALSRTHPIMPDATAKNTKNSLEGQDLNGAKWGIYRWNHI